MSFFKSLYNILILISINIFFGISITYAVCTACLSQTDSFTGKIQDPQPPVDVFFLVDVSGSVSNDDYDKFTEAVQELLTMFDFGAGAFDDRYAVVQFSNTQLIFTPWEDNWDQTLSWGPNIKITNGSTDGITSVMETDPAAYSTSRDVSPGFTALADSLKVYDKYMDQASRQDSIQLVIIIHDMGDADDPNEITYAITETDRMKAAGKFFVSIRTLSSSPTTDAYASTGAAFEVTNIENLVTTIQDEIIDKVLAEVYIEDEFDLTNDVDVDALDNIQVSIEGSVVTSEKWTYDSLTRTIKFTQKEFAPRDGESLTVQYCSSCGECDNNDTQCTTSTNPLCNVNLCVPCNDASIDDPQARCATKTIGSVCAVNTGAQQGECVTGDCLADNDCPFNTALCLNYNCTACSTDTECARFTSTPNCNTGTGICVNCVDGSDCGIGQVCDNNTCVAGDCVIDTDCPITDPVCLTNTCSDCTSDPQCARFPAALNCNTSTGVCVNCFNNADCLTGEVCDSNICVTGNCIIDTDCPLTDPVCLSNNCTDCTIDAQCARFTATPNCNTSTGVCVNCVDSNDCATGEVCSGNICTSGNCVVDSDCPATDPVCSGNLCTDCTADTQCVRFTVLPNCNTSTGACVNCVDNSDCLAGQVCDGSSCVTGNCVTDSDCPITDPVCVSNNCSDCTNDGHCTRFTGAQNCDTSSGICKNCVNNDDCGIGQVCDGDTCVTGNCVIDTDCPSDDPICVANTCSDCTADTQCTRFTGLPNCNVSNGKCVNCVNGDDCPSGQVCSSNSCVIGNCILDTDCPFTDPVCIGNVCTDCTSDTQCTRFSITPNCNIISGVCVNCVDNNDCGAGQVCDGNTCVSGNCISDTDCPLTDPVCVSNACTDCTIDTQCTRFPDSQVCNTATGGCVGCLDNSNCSNNQVCVNNSCVIGNCLTNDDCPFDDPVCIGYTCSNCSSDTHCSRFANTPNCNNSTGECVDCIDNADCGAGFVCVDNSCVVGNCLQDNDCAYTDPVCLSYTCNDCDNDSDCNRFGNLEVCAKSGGQASNKLGQCVECNVHSNCTDDSKPICFNGSCQSCSDSSDDTVCAGLNSNRPYCGLSGTYSGNKQGECVECNQVTDCTDPNKPVCENGLCRKCNKSDDDTACELQNNNLPYCGYSSAVVGSGNVGTCVECRTSDQCSDPHKPICNLGLCKGCHEVSNGDLSCQNITGDSNKLCVKEGANLGACADCLNDDQCQILYRDKSKPVCLSLSDTNICGCSNSSDCTSKRYSNCDIGSNTCIGCLDDSSCEKFTLNKSCQLPEGECVCTSRCGCNADIDCFDGEVCFNGNCVAIPENDGLDCAVASQGVFVDVPELDNNCGKTEINADEANYSFKYYCTKNHKTACSFCKKHILQTDNCVEACEQGNKSVCQRCQQTENTQGVCDIIECLYKLPGCNSGSMRKYSVDLILPMCGNGTVEYPEQCDDGNLNNNDGCSDVCNDE